MMQHQVDPMMQLDPISTIPYLHGTWSFLLVDLCVTLWQRPLVSSDLRALRVVSAGVFLLVVCQFACLSLPICWSVRPDKPSLWSSDLCAACLLACLSVLNN